ncbi:MAG: DUF4838 domain-containing protein [Planctomycetes bacterium]|nr:DUF4838 domain-containing protein [Planctomycetota bacterium]
MLVPTACCCIHGRRANRLFHILALAIFLATTGGCQSSTSSLQMTVIAPDQPCRGTVTIRLAGCVIRPDSYAIFLPAQPTPTERTAAQELELHLRLITGHEFAVLPETQRGDRHGFFIGRCRTYSLPEADFTSLGADGLIIRSHGADLQLMGNKRGVLYAVSVFLDECLGCRWFAADCMRVPTGGEISLGAIDRRYVPPLMNRALDYPEHRGTLFAMRNRLTSAGADLGGAHGGRIDYYPFVHSFAELVSPAKYFAQHPDYYSLNDGKRTADGQLCLTNPEVLTIAKATVRRWIKEHPEAQIISVSQNDNQRYCQCDKCTALAKEEGSQAGPLLHFVNAIAADIARDYPDKIIDTLAYMYTRKPPLHVQPAPNVTIRLCSIECCFSHPIEGSTENGSFMEDLRGWSRICRRLSIWDYVISYRNTLAPWPNLYVLQPNIKTFVDHGATSVYEESNYFSPGGEMAPLRTYIMAKALWDPTYDTDRAIDEFLPAYYGAAAPYLRQYIDLLHRPFRNGKGPHITIWLSDPWNYLDGEFLPHAHALFAQAREAVRDDPARLRRVRLAHLGAIYMTLFETPIYERRGDRLIWRARPPEGIDAWSEFWDVVAIEKITSHQEGLGIEAIKKTHVSAGGQNPIVFGGIPSPGELTIQRLHNRDVEVECIPGFGGRIHALINRHTGRDWLKGNHPNGYTLIDESGSELYSERPWRSSGWATPFQVTEIDENHIVMHATLDNGLELERRLTLPEGTRASIVRCRDSIRNTSSQPREATLRIHPVINMVHPASTHLIVRNAAGEDRPLDLPKSTNTQEPTADCYLEGPNRPAGWWSVADDATHEQLIHRLIAGEVGQYFVSVNYALRQLTLELWSPTRTLKPGEEIAIEHEYETR